MFTNSVSSASIKRAIQKGQKFRYRWITLSFHAGYTMSLYKRRVGR